MPIIELPDPSQPLSQGDILKDVKLYVSKGGWLDSGGEPQGINHRLCMILSRPCVTAHKPNVIVSAIERYKEGIPSDIEDFDDALEFVTGLRDGGDSTDLFYLGQLPGQEDGRFAARLDNLHTIQVPQKNEDLVAFLSSRRIARLNQEFVRDLHVRIFLSFASLGFSDIRWLSTADLRWLVALAKRDMAKVEAALLEEQVKLESGTAHGFAKPEDRDKVDKEIARIQKKSVNVKRFLDDYGRELDNRTPPSEEV